MFQSMDSNDRKTNPVRGPARLGQLARRTGLAIRLMIGSACAAILLFLAVQLATVGKAAFAAEGVKVSSTGRIAKGERK